MGVGQSSFLGAEPSRNRRERGEESERGTELQLDNQRQDLLVLRAAGAAGREINGTLYFSVHGNWEAWLCLSVWHDEEECKT